MMRWNNNLAWQRLKKRNLRNLYSLAVLVPAVNVIYEINSNGTPAWIKESF
jgi:hypothetical protein